MDKLQSRLRQDAAAIDAEVTDTLRERLDARLADERPQMPRTGRTVRPLWLGLAAAAGLAAVTWWVSTERFSSPPAESFATPPQFVDAMPSPLDLRVKPVELEEPLEVELRSLRADLEKVRSSIEQELRSTL